MISWFLTSSDLKSALAPQKSLQWTPQNITPLPSSHLVISVNESNKYQSLVGQSYPISVVLLKMHLCYAGIGSSLEASTCFNMFRLDAEARADLLTELFDLSSGIGLSLMRITIGTSDFTPLPFYSYDDQILPDPELSNFSISKDEDFIIPCIQQAMKAAAGNELTLFASPWSGPPWMKTSKTLQGGSLIPMYYDSYSRYLLKFVQAYERAGVPIHAITPQNEPLVNSSSYPSTLMLPHEEAELISKHLGPIFAQFSPNTKIWCFDHNFEDHYYPDKVLGDHLASGYIDGTGFHHYAGFPNAMTSLHEKFPDKNVYFTEGSVFGVFGAVEIITYFRNWARSYSKCF
jgi:O-glycosyl hydrolase